MQGITQEMNFSETTFVYSSITKKCVRKVRIFTPGREIPFAGHPTLGTAFVLRNQGIIQADENRAFLELGIGPIEVKFCENDHVQMYQPIPQFLEVFKDKELIAKVLRVAPTDISDKWPMQFISTGFPYLIVPITSLATIQKIHLNAELLVESLTDFPAQDLVILSPETIHRDSHAHVRMFAPSAGVLEDPATGSAAGPIAAYLEANKILFNHKKGSKIILEQGYELNRPSKLIAECLFQNRDFAEIIVGGRVRLTAEGCFFL